MSRELTVRREIAEDIGRLDRELARLAPREQMRRLLSIKSMARTQGLRAVASLAHALETDLLAYGAEVPIHSYLDRMLDAVEVGDEQQPRFVDLALATVGAGLAFA
jgi:HPt (histidine-containing phosphotransfer) domain-containing protein